MPVAFHGSGEDIELLAHGSENMRQAWVPISRPISREGPRRDREAQRGAQ